MSDDYYESRYRERDHDNNADFEDGDRGGSRAGGGFRRRGRPSGPGGGRRRSRTFHKEQIAKAEYKIDYKNVDLLKMFVTERGKIRPSRQTNVSAKQQRAVSCAIKRARHMALLPFVEDNEG